MIFAVTAQQMKIAEQNAFAGGITPLELTENAGAAVAERLDKMTKGGVKNKAVSILCGRGNNGGDGVVIAARLMQMGAEAFCIFVEDLPNSPTAREVHSKYCNGENPVPYSLYIHREQTVRTVLESSDIIIDCVYGTGFRGALELPLAELFAFVGEQCDHALRIAVDMPSGVNATSGEISTGSFKPDATITLGAIKTGLLSLPCFDFAGDIIIANINLPDECYTEYEARLTSNDILSFIPKRKKTSHKGDFGRLLNVAGSERYIGAAVLSTKAALKAGAGLVMLAAPKAVTHIAAVTLPEAIYIPLAEQERLQENDPTTLIAGELKNCTAVTVGCGMGTDHNTCRIVEYLLRYAGCPLIIDADGINAIAEHNIVIRDNTKQDIILTPHPGEFARLTGMSVEQVQKDRIGHAKRFAQQHNVILLLKGAASVIASPDGRTYVNTSGNAALARGGSGDVLTGMIGAFAAAGVPAFEAVVLGAYLHGCCADALVKSVSPAGILPTDITEVLPFVMAGRDTVQ
jgi:NAD(P)H-hydrate epimerase